MKDLSMFGKLRNYVSDTGFILDHEYFQIITDQRKYRYKIFSCKIVPDDSDVYTIFGAGTQDFLTFVCSILQKGNNLEINYDIECDDHVITLSTCSGDNRIVVSAVKIAEDIADTLDCETTSVSVVIKEVASNKCLGLLSLYIE